MAPRLRLRLRTLGLCETSNRPGLPARAAAQALVELGLILPVLLLILLGMFDLGRGLVFGVAVQYGAGEAARLGAMQYANPALGVTSAKIYQRLIDASAPALVGCTAGSGSSMTCTDAAGRSWTLSITYSPSQASGNSIEVKAVGSVGLYSGFATPFGGLGSITVQGDAVSVVL
jgi:Flp pilus assembly protein TadG